MADFRHYLGTTFDIRVEAVPTPQTQSLYPDLTAAILRAELRRPGDYKLAALTIDIEPVSPLSFGLSIPLESQARIAPGVWTLQVWATEERPDPSPPLVRAFAPIEIEFVQGPAPSNPSPSPSPSP